MWALLCAEYEARFNIKTDATPMHEEAWVQSTWRECVAQPGTQARWGQPPGSQSGPAGHAGSSARTMPLSDPRATGQKVDRWRVYQSGRAVTELRGVRLLQVWWVVKSVCYKGTPQEHPKTRWPQDATGEYAAFLSRSRTCHLILMQAKAPFKERI